MKNVISASRRTDIPAFYIDWFIKRLESGYLYARNPYSGRTFRVCLRPESVHSIVFWSKNFRPLISKIERIEKACRKLFFHFTITGLPQSLEPRTPDCREAVEDFIYISKRYSPGHIIWRFDPIVITENLNFEFYEEVFARCAESLKGHADACHTSFVNTYKKVLQNFAKHSRRIADVTEKEKRIFAGRLGALSLRYGLKLYSCCNDILLSENVFKASCINGRQLARLFIDNDLSAEPAPTRDGCACTRSIDIGSYDTCAHGCLYCYANDEREKAEDFLKNHNPEWNGLGFNADESVQT